MKSGQRKVEQGFRYDTRKEIVLHSGKVQCGTEYGRAGCSDGQIGVCMVSNVKWVSLKTLKCYSRAELCLLLSKNRLKVCNTYGDIRYVPILKMKRL